MAETQVQHIEVQQVNEVPRSKATRETVVQFEIKEATETLEIQCLEFRAKVCV